MAQAHQPPPRPQEFQLDVHTPSTRGRAMHPASPLANRPAIEIDETAFIHAMRALFERFGQRGLVVVTTVVALVMSVVLTASIQWAMTGLVDMAFWIGMSLAVTVPLLVATPVSYLVAQLVAHQMRLEVKLLDQSTRDSLTGLPNRRWILAQGPAPAEHEARPSLGVLMIDVDHFKSINDRYGHLGGDAVLGAVATALARQLRPGEKVGRYGGEEFLVLTNETSPAAVIEIGERLRHAVAQLSVDGVDARLRVTVSVGAAVQAGGLASSFEDAVRRADEALYRAKNGGRNRVELAQANGPIELDSTPA